MRDKIKFTVESSGSQLVFLDTKVHLREGFLVPEIYSKPTGSHEYLNKHFIKVAKLKRKAVLEGKLPSKRKLESTRISKINFVPSWDPMFPDINKALRKFQRMLEDDDQCKQLFPRGTFRVAYKRGHKNLKELIAPARVALACLQALTMIEIHKVNVLNVEVVEHQTGVGKESLVSTRVKWSRRVVALKVTKQARFIKSDKILTVEVKI